MDTSKTKTLDAKLERMRAMFAPMRSLIVAFSGGVDSTFVLNVAHEVLGDAVLALTTTSPTMPDEDRESAIAMARLIGARHLIVESNELEIPGYAANPLNRCYLCKHNLFTVCEAKAAELGIDEIVDGLNLDDLHDYRPGMQAASEKRVRHPLVEAEMTKADVRELSRAMGLPTWDRPASPCLSSRFPVRHDDHARRAEESRGGREAASFDGLCGRARAVSWRGRAARARAERDRAHLRAGDPRNDRARVQKNRVSIRRDRSEGLSLGIAQRRTDRERAKAGGNADARRAPKSDQYGRPPNGRFVAAG